MDDGDGPLGPLEHMGHIAEGVENRLVRADDPAGATVDAQGGLNKVRFFRLTADRLGRAAFFAGATAGAVFRDNGKRHPGSSLLLHLL